MATVDGHMTAAAMRVAELAREQADEIEAKRRMPDEIVDVLRDSGINRMTLPTVLRGAPVSPRETLDVIATISAADGSAGWCAVIGALTNIFAGYVPEDSAREIWSDPDAAGASMFGPYGNAIAVGDGDRFRLTGRWPFTSNCLHSEWIGLAAWFKASIDADPEPSPRLVFVPSESIEIDDTWDVGGLRGTGSHDTSVADIEVRRTYSCAFHEPTWPDEPLWKLTLFTALIPGLVAVPLGIARGALDDLEQQARNQRPSPRGALLDDSMAMAEFARAERWCARRVPASRSRSTRRGSRHCAVTPPRSRRRHALQMAAQVACDIAVRRPAPRTTSAGVRASITERDAAPTPGRADRASAHRVQPWQAADAGPSDLRSRHFRSADHRLTGILRRFSPRSRRVSSAAFASETQVRSECERRESNPYVFRHWDLNRRTQVSPRSRASGKATSSGHSRSARPASLLAIASVDCE